MKENMRLNILVWLVALLGSSQVLAQQGKAPRPSAAELRTFRLSMCELSADKAKSIISATIKSQERDVDAEIVVQTIEGSPERKLMQQIFHRDDLVSTVLIRSANSSSVAVTLQEDREYKQGIIELTYRYVRNSCIAATL